MGAATGTVRVVPSMTTTGAVGATTVVVTPSTTTTEELARTIVVVRPSVTMTDGTAAGFVGWVDGTEITTPEMVVCWPGLSVWSPGRTTAPGLTEVAGLLPVFIPVGTGTGTIGKGSSGSLLGVTGTTGGGLPSVGLGVEGLEPAGGLVFPGAGRVLTFVGAGLGAAGG